MKLGDVTRTALACVRVASARSCPVVSLVASKRQR